MCFRSSHSLRTSSFIFVSVLFHLCIIYENSMHATFIVSHNRFSSKLTVQVLDFFEDIFWQHEASHLPTILSWIIGLVVCLLCQGWRPIQIFYVWSNIWTNCSSWCSAKGNLVNIVLVLHLFHITKWKWHLNL